MRSNWLVSLFRKFSHHVSFCRAVRERFALPETADSETGTKATFLFPFPFLKFYCLILLGSRLALCGFDPIIRLHVRYFWLHAEQASRNMQKEDGYIPELDSFQLDHLGAARRRKQADRGIDKPKYKKVKITTNGRAKRGPKRIEPRPKMVPDTVKRYVM